MSEENKKQRATFKMTSEEEKVFFDRICAFSKKDEDTVRDVLRAILMVTVAGLFSNRKRVCIPYMCSLDIDFKDKLKQEDKNFWKITDVKLNATAMDSLVKEIEAISEGEFPPSLEFFMSKIEMKVEDFLDLPRGVDIEEE